MFKKGESHSCYISPQTHCRQETALLPPTEPQAEEVRASKAPPLWFPLPLLLSTREPLFILLSIHIGMDSQLFYTRGHNPILPYFDTKNCSGLTTDRQLCSWFLWPSDIFPSVCEHMSELCGASSRTPWLSFPALGTVWGRNFHFTVPDNVSFSFLWSPHMAVSQFLWLFPVPNWEIMLSGPLGSYRETAHSNTTQAEPSCRPAYDKERLSLQLCLESSHWKFKERVREKARRCPAGDVSALKMTSVSVVLTIYVFTRAGRKTAEANRQCWQPQFWVWECGYCFLLFTCCNSSNKPKGGGQGKQPNKKTPKLFSFFFS